MKRIFDDVGQANFAIHVGKANERWALHNNFSLCDRHTIFIVEDHAYYLNPHKPAPLSIVVDLNA